jgi:hypothetical protein
MMYGPPRDLTMPRADERDGGRDVGGTAWCVIVAAVVALVAFFVLARINEAHAFHGDRAPTDAYLACLRAAATPEAVASCRPQMPWYAAHPAWYAIAIGLAVFVVARLVVFMARMERARG